MASATRACELGGWKHAGDLDTLAAACAEAGDFAMAVKSQEKALELTSDEKDKEKFHGHLALYQVKQPYREQTRAR